MHSNSISTTKPITVNTVTNATPLVPLKNTQYSGYVNQNMIPTLSPHHQQYAVSNSGIIPAYASSIPLQPLAPPPPPPPQSSQQHAIFTNSPNHQISPASLSSSTQPIIIQQQPSPQLPPTQVYHPNYYAQPSAVSQPAQNGINNIFYSNNPIVQQAPGQLMMSSQVVKLNQSYPPQNYPVNNTQSNHSKASFSNNNKNLAKNSNNSKNRSIKVKSNSTQKQPSEINIDDSHAFPSLVSPRSNSVKSSKIANKIPSDAENDDSDSSQEKGEKAQALKPVKPYIEDGVKFEKVKKNFSFIRSTIEQHYMNENSRNNQRNQLSFKDAVLKKPVQKLTVTEEIPSVENKVNAKEAKAKKPEPSSKSNDSKLDAELKVETKSKKKKSDKKKSNKL